MGNCCTVDSKYAEERRKSTHLKLRAAEIKTSLQNPKPMHSSQQPQLSQPPQLSEPPQPDESSPREKFSFTFATTMTPTFAMSS
jgi:hypothetical protein